MRRYSLSPVRIALTVVDNGQLTSPILAISTINVGVGALPQALRVLRQQTVYPTTRNIITIDNSNSVRIIASATSESQAPQAPSSSNQQYWF